MDVCFKTVFDNKYSDMVARVVTELVRNRGMSLASIKQQTVKLAGDNTTITISVNSDVEVVSCSKIGLNAFTALLYVAGLFSEYTPPDRLIVERIQ